MPRRHGWSFIEDVIDGPDLNLELAIFLSDFEVLEGHLLDLLVKGEDALVEVFL